MANIYREYIYFEQTRTTMAFGVDRVKEDRWTVFAGPMTCGTFPTMKRAYEQLATVIGNALASGGELTDLRENSKWQS